MSWTRDDVMAALTVSPSPSAGHVNLSLAELDVPVGLGRDETGCLILVIPDVEDSDAYHGRNADFEVGQHIRRAETDEVIGPVAVMRCDYSSLGTAQLEALASALTGVRKLILESQTTTAARACAGIAQLVDLNQLLRPTTEAVIGLVGELATILAADDPDIMAEAWHVDPNDPFDFSLKQARLEVKSTAGRVREHEISTSQVALVSDWTHLASVRVALVSSGETVSQLTGDVLERLSKPHLAAKVRALVQSSLGLPPDLVDTPQFDVVSTVKSLRIWPLSGIPSPHLANGVTWMRWGFLLSEAQPAIPQLTPLIAGLVPKS